MTLQNKVIISLIKQNHKSFNDSSFDLLMNYFNNLDEKQKKFMSYHIPSKFIIISSKMKKDKLRSIIVQSILRKKLILPYDPKFNPIYFYNILFIIP